MLQRESGGSNADQNHRNHTLSPHLLNANLPQVLCNLHAMVQHTLHSGSKQAEGGRLLGGGVTFAALSGDRFQATSDAHDTANMPPPRLLHAGPQAGDRSRRFVQVSAAEGGQRQHCIPELRSGWRPAA